MSARELALYEALALARAALRTLRHKKDDAGSVELARRMLDEAERLLGALAPR